MNKFKDQLPLKKNPTKIFGLKYEPSLEPEVNDNDDGFPLNFYANPCQVFHPRVEVSKKNFDLCAQMSKLFSSHGIVEIGVARNGNNSMTHAILSGKPDNIPYLGIDLEDKSFLNDPLKNIFTIQANSLEQDIIRNKIREVGINEISLLMIDGWHSVNMVINDWKYADLLSKNGCVLFHDSNTHPGPVSIIDAIDENLFNKEGYFFEDYEDHGIFAAFKK